MVDRSDAAGSMRDVGEPTAKAQPQGESPPPPERLRSRSRGRDAPPTTEDWSRVQKNQESLYTSVVYVREKTREFAATQREMQEAQSKTQHIMQAAGEGFKKLEAAVGETAAKSEATSNEVKTYAKNLEARLVEAETRLTQNLQRQFEEVASKVETRAYTELLESRLHAAEVQLTTKLAELDNKLVAARSGVEPVELERRLQAAEAQLTARLLELDNRLAAARNSVEPIVGELARKNAAHEQRSTEFGNCLASLQSTCIGHGARLDYLTAEVKIAVEELQTAVGETGKGGFARRCSRFVDACGRQPP